MDSFFSRFASSFTPYFLGRFKKTTLGQAILYYFIWFLIGTIVVIIGLGFFLWHISAPAKITPLLSKIPPFALQFQDNKLVKTTFPTDPFVVPFEGTFFVFISPKSTVIPPEYASQPGLYFLHDRFIGNQVQSAAKKTTEVSYVDMKLGNTLFNNALLAERFSTIYPLVRNRVFPMIFPVGLLIGGVLSVFFLVLSLFLVICDISGEQNRKTSVSLLFRIPGICPPCFLSSRSHYRRFYPLSYILSFLAFSPIYRHISL